MAWIESHQTLLTHRKTITLRVALGVKHNEVIGLLHRLWWWSLDNAPDGYIGGMVGAVIAEACGWDGDEQLLNQSLRDAGFIDQDGRLHDWAEYAGRLINDRRRDRERKHLERARTDQARKQELLSLSGGHPADIHSPSQGVPGVPNPTQPNTIPPLRARDPGSSDIPTREEAINRTMVAGIAQDFAGYVYDDWAGRGGRDAANCVRPWLQYVTTRWSRERQEWTSGTHKGKNHGKPNGKPGTQRVDRNAGTANAGAASEYEGLG